MLTDCGPNWVTDSSDADTWCRGDEMQCGSKLSSQFMGVPPGILVKNDVEKFVEDVFPQIFIAIKVWNLENDERNLASIMVMKASSS